MTSDALSPIHRALRWSLPGAALLSIPVTLWLANGPLRPFVRLSDFRPPEILIGLALLFLATITLVASAKALVCLSKTPEPFSFSVIAVRVFNLVAILGALVALVMAFVAFRLAGMN